MNPELWHALGAAYKAMKYKESAKNIRTATQMISIDYAFYLQLGHVLCSNAQYQDAIDAYNTAIQRAWNQSITWAFVEHWDAEDVHFPDLTTRISIDESLEKKFLWVWLGKAHSVVNDGDSSTKIYSAAIDVYKDALTKGTRNNLLWKYNRAEVYLGLFDVFKVQQSLPNRILWYALAMGYECRGMIKLALKAYRKSLDLEPDNVWLPCKILNM